MIPMIRNLVFDLGNVLFALDFSRTEDAFRKLQCTDGPFPSLDYHFSGEDLTVFDRFETGVISAHEFREELREIFHLRGEDALIDAAWNALLTGPIEANTALLPRLAVKYRIFLLSNTNEVHISHVESVCPGLLPSFEACFFSHELGIRKPGPEIFRHVLKERSLVPLETLFIDDSGRNIEGARHVGLRVLHLDAPAALADRLGRALGPF